jgi:pyruvate dehydrogenase E1 component alpha subunit/2-oxoisovalerate dehydrogenase E1 component alpha subunit
MQEPMIDSSASSSAASSASSIGPGPGEAGAIHRHMTRARVISARMVALQRAERIGFHTSSIGEEAAIVGTTLAAGATDWIFPGAREWYAALARGMPVAAYVHHAFGSAADPAKGHASPDHAPARRWNVVPPSGVVGAHLPQGVGAAWAAKIAKTDVAAVVLFDADVTSTGDFHNALNFAGVMKAPVVLACRAKSGGKHRVADRAVAYGVASARVDGSDALAVCSVVQAALARAREGKGATLVEIVTPVLSALLTPESVHDDDAVLDLGADDPLARLRSALVRDKVLEPGAEAAIVKALRDELDAAIADATRIGPPAAATIFEDVYAGVPAHLQGQRSNMGDRVG